jgi:P-type Ca2+ transporter type 2C
MKTPQIADINEITQNILDNLNVPQARDENREYLSSLGGIETFCSKLGASLTTGLTNSQVEIMRGKYGTNSFPESPMRGFFELFWEAFQDTTLMILIAAAIVSLVIGIVEHGAADGWIEGGAILIAVFLVASVTAFNDYTKELQFRALEKSSQGDERCSVIRDSQIERINPKDLVVGDLILLQAGDAIPADCIICDNNVIKCNESALTGESDDLGKSKLKDCFLLSSCLVTEGEEAHALVIGIGPFSQWGKIKSNLVSEAVNTPLQDKLEHMAEQVQYISFSSYSLLSSHLLSPPPTPPPCPIRSVTSVSFPLLEHSLPWSSPSGHAIMVKMSWVVSLKHSFSL